ncbi:MAG: LytTR family DNA-binding domain-containing protein [Clostridium sp.]|jgi:DNA-binding LytR/AlgR family response regulator|nr:LytTR family DNA-binding domain-containing protein [Clostridium sp.]
MQIKIVLCDDRPQDLGALQTQIVRASEQIGWEAVTYPCKDGQEVIRLLCDQKERFDILFLDIYMPGISGLEVARKIREAGLGIVLVFVSACAQHVFEAIQYGPFRYVRKNRMEQELPQTLQAAVSFLESQNEKTMILKTDAGDVKIKPSEIMYYETEGKKVVIHLKDGKDYFVWKTIKELKQKLKEEVFVSIHSGCVVNTRYLSECSSFGVTLKNGKRLIASRRKRSNVRNAFLKSDG